MNRCCGNLHTHSENRREYCSTCGAENPDHDWQARGKHESKKAFEGKRRVDPSTVMAEIRVPTSEAEAFKEGWFAFLMEESERLKDVTATLGLAR